MKNVNSPRSLVSDRAGNGPRRIKNIQELAVIAGVSAGTVSRALAGKDMVKKDTRDRIQRIAQEHGFRPNLMARKLRTQVTGVISLVFPLGHEQRQHISDPFFLNLFGYLADQLTESGYDLMLSRVIPGDSDWLDRIVGSGMIDGILMIGQSDQFEIIERVAEYYRPMVVWGSHRAGQVHCTVGSDNYLGGRLAARRILERGARHLAFFGDTRGPEIEQRLQGVRAEVAEHPKVTLRVFATHLSSEEMAQQIAEHLDDLDGKVDGIVASTDMIAIATLAQLRNRGISVPEQVAVVGYDDVPLASQTMPTLTTIRQDIAQGARLMVDALQRRLAQENAASTVLPPELIVRDSA